MTRAARFKAPAAVLPLRQETPTEGVWYTSSGSADGLKVGDSRSRATVSPVETECQRNNQRLTEEDRR